MATTSRFQEVADQLNQEKVEQGPCLGVAQKQGTLAPPASGLSILALVPSEIRDSMDHRTWRLAPLDMFWLEWRRNSLQILHQSPASCSDTLPVSGLREVSLYHNTVTGVAYKFDQICNPIVLLSLSFGDQYHETYANAYVEPTPLHDVAYMV